MADHSLAIRRAVVARLRADAGIQGFVDERVYDTVPEGAAAQRPYIRYGFPIIVPFDGDEIAGIDADLTVHVFDEGPANDRVHLIMRELAREGLIAESNFAIEDGTLYFVTWMGSQLLPDETAGRNHHGIVQFRAVTG